MVYPALGAAELLANDGIDATVVNARFVKPLDESLLLDLAASHEAIITIEENVVHGGFGSAILELFAAHDQSVTVRTLGVPDRFYEQASQSRLRELAGLSPQQIYAEARTLLVAPAPITAPIVSA